MGSHFNFLMYSDILKLLLSAIKENNKLSREHWVVGRAASDWWSGKTCLRKLCLRAKGSGWGRLREQHEWRPYNRKKHGAFTEMEERRPVWLEGRNNSESHEMRLRRKAGKSQTKLNFI